MNVENVERITRAMITAESQRDLRRELSPEGLYEIILNIFTFGGVTREKNKIYQELYDKLTDKVILLHTQNQHNDNDSFSIEFQGVDIVFRSVGEQQQGAFGTKKTIIKIKTKKNDYCQGIEVEYDVFRKSRTVMLLRGLNNNEHRYENLLTEGGMMNLKYHNFYNFNFPQKINLSESDFEGSFFSRCIFIRVILEGGNMKNTIFEYCDFNHFEMKGGCLDRCLMKCCNMNHTEITYLTANQWVVRMCNIANSSVIGIHGESTQWDNSKMRDTIMNHCYLRSAVFVNSTSVIDSLGFSYTPDSFAKMGRDNRSYQLNDLISSQVIQKHGNPIRRASSVPVLPYCTES